MPDEILPRQAGRRDLTSFLSDTCREVEKKNETS